MNACVLWARSRETWRVRTRGAMFSISTLYEDAEGQKVRALHLFVFSSFYLCISASLYCLFCSSLVSSLTSHRSSLHPILSRSLSPPFSPSHSHLLSNHCVVFIKCLCVRGQSVSFVDKHGVIPIPELSECLVTASNLHTEQESS